MTPGASQPPIADLGLIGDTRTAALVADGEIVWMSAPRFDDPPVFGTLVDPSDGGRFSIRPVEPVRSTSSYVSGTPVLTTRWRASTGEVVLTDGLVSELRGALLPEVMLVRELTCTSGRVDVEVRFDPRQGLPGTPPRWREQHGHLMAGRGPAVLSLGSTVPDLVPGKPVRVTLEEGEEHAFVLSFTRHSPHIFVPVSLARDALASTITWWRAWSRELDVGALEPDLVTRSLITLRLLTYSPSGASVAAPTTSLPEWIGGSRNWDYRYAWPRDASLAMRAFLGAGQTREAIGFMRWLLHAARSTRPRIEVMYDLDGRPARKEREVAADGYRGSRPVRIGNAARDQLQLDVYGWVLDAVHAVVSNGAEVPAEVWRMCRAAADHVAESWMQPDNGIWEIRGPRANYVHSKMMSWLALDRACALAAALGRRGPVEKWRAAAERIREDIMKNGLRRDGVFVQRYGSDALDASVLSVLDEFESDPHRMRSTMDALRDQLGTGALLRRYGAPDGIRGAEGAFLACSFWLVRCLARGGAVDEAMRVLDDLKPRFTRLGLLSEQVDPSTGELLGNFPQALSHASFVIAVQELERQLMNAPRMVP